MSKNAKQLFKENKFGIRKFTVGVASVIIGTSFYLGAENQAQAAELNQTEMSSSQESSGVNSGNNENVETDQSTTKETNVAEQSNVENTTNNTESTTNTLDNESVNTNEDTSVKSVESNETSKTDETNTNTEESTRDTNVESTTDTSASNKKIEEKTDNTTVTAPKEEQSQNETTVDNNEKEVNTSETNNVESKTEQNQPSTDNTEDRTTADDKSELDQPVNNNVEKETPKEETSPETSKEDSTEHKEEASNESVNNNSTDKTENKVDSTNTNNNNKEVAPKEDKSTTQTESTENTTKEEPKSEEIETTSDESNKEDTNTKSINDNVDTSNKINSGYENTNSVNTTQDNSSNVLTSEESKDLAKIQNVSVLNAPLLPVSDNPKDGYTLNAGLNEPVVTTRETGKEATAITATTVTKNAEYFEDPSLLTSDKYEILELTSENVKGKDKYTKDTFNTHMVIKLDDSVKPGDKLVYGVGYDYTDLNGDIHKVYLPASNDNLSHTVPIIYQNAQIGTMTLPSPSYETNELPPRYFSLDEVNGVDERYYAMKGSPVTIRFNNNIDKFKDVELTLDNVFINDKSRVSLNSSTINGLYIDKGYTNSYITRNSDGSIDVDIPNEFQINDQIKDLNLKIEATESTDSLKSMSGFNDNHAWNNTLMTRQYLDTPNGLYVNDINTKVYRSAVPSKTPTKELQYHIVVPKELQDKADFAFAGITNNPDLKFNNDYLSPHQDTISAQSKFNPTTFDPNIYTGYTSNIKTTSPNIDWDITRNLTTNDNGDLVYDVTFKTKDGSYVTPINDPVYLYAYRLNDNLAHSDVETYEDADKNNRYEKWSIPEWDALLKENPITMTVDSVTETGNKTVTTNVDKEGYRIEKATAQTAPEGSVRVAAKDEMVVENTKTEDIDYKVIRIPDSTLDEGVEIIQTEGVKGTRTYTERVFTKTTTGEITDVQRIDETITKEPVDKVVRYGVNTNIDDVTYNKKITENKNTAPQENKKIDSLNMSLTPDSGEQVIVDGHDGIKYTGADGEIILSNDDTNIFDNINTSSKQTIFDKEKENFKSDLDSKISYTNLNISDFKEVENSDGTKSYVASYHYDYQLAPFENVVDTYVEHSPHAYDSTISHNETSYKTVREIDWDLKPGSDDVVITQGENGYSDVIGHYLSGYDSTLTSEFGWEPYFDGNRELLSDEERENFENSLNHSYGIDVLKEQYPNLELESFKDGILKVKIGESESSKDAINEVIHYAPVEIPYETKEIKTNELKKGETKVQSEGHIGLKDPETGEVHVEAENRVILVGTGIEDSFEYTITKDVPFDTHYTFDKSKPVDYKETKTEGRNGIETITVTQKTVDGKPVGEPTYSEPVTTQEKIDKEVIIGTGVVGKNTTVKDIITKYETEIRKNDKLEVGTRNVIKEGQVGIDRKTTVHYTLNGEDDPTRTDDVSTKHIQDKIDEIVEIGTAVKGSRTETKDVLVDFERKEVKDSSLPEGKTEIIQTGEKGIDRITTTYPTLNGEDSGEGVPSTEHIKDPVKEIVRIGTGVVGENKSTTTKTIPFETETIKLDSVPEGETRVAREGENGIRTITTITPTLNGEVNGDSKDIPVVTKQPVNKIVVVGTGKETTETSHYDTEVKFDKEIIYDDNLKKGETETRQTGKNGIDRTTVTTHYLNGKQYGDQETTTDRITDPINEIIAVGTAVEVQDRTVVQNEVDFETEYVDTKDLKAGETRIKQAGQKGIDTTTTVRTLLNDEVINTDTNTVRTKDPVTQIIERGIGEVGSTTSDTKYEIPYGYDERYDDTLEQGKREVLKKGETGLDIIKVTRPTLNGEIDETGDVTVEKVHVKDPVDEIVRIGTGVKGTNTKERIEEVDFETEYVDNNQLPKGEERIKVQGEVGFDKIITTENTLNGKVVDSSDDKTRLKDPVTQIIERGTGIVDVKTETDTVKVPFDEKEVLDKTLKQGERVIDVPGEDGIDTIITTTPTLNGNVNGDSKTRVEHTKAPKTQIVRVGAGVEGQNKVTETVPVPFETKYINDENLPKGKEIVDVNGIDGVDKITTIIPTFNGEELTNQAKSSTEHVKAPTDRVIRRGTGIEDIRTETKTEPLKYGTDKVFDRDLPEGYKEVIRDGVNGEITTTITTPTLNGKDNGPSDTSKVITKKPVNEIVKIGTGKLITKTTTSKTSNNFKIIYKESDELEKGQTKVLKHGQNGIVETITKQDYVNGKKYGDPDVTTNELQSVIDEVVLIGTKEPSNPVKPLDPDNNNYDPNGNDITKDKGHKTTPKEITDQVEIPKYPSDKGIPVKTVEDETLIPDGNTTGDYTVPVIVTYPDGSKDYVGVIVHIIDTDDDESIVKKVIDKDTGEIVRTDNSNNETISTSNTKYVIDNNSSELIDDKGHIGIQMNKQQDGHTKYIIDEKPVQSNISNKEDNVINQNSNKDVNELPETGNEQQSKTVTLGLITMALGAALTFVRRRKQKEDK